MENLFTNHQVSTQRILYTPSSFARTNLLYLQEIGTLRALHPHVTGRENLDSYLFFVVTEGEGELTYKGERYPLGPGDCVFLNCAGAYSHCSSERLWSLKWCHFYGPNLPGIYRKYVERGGYCAFHPDCAEGYIRLLDELYALAASVVHTRDMRIYDKLSTLVTMIMEESWHPETQSIGVPQKRDVLEVKGYIDSHFDQPLTLESLASHFYISKHYLARCFKAQCGVTVTTYIQQVRVTQAKHHLRFTEEPIERIAVLCGIGDANYFSRIFKKVEGTTPGEFRRTWKG